MQPDWVFVAKANVGIIQKQGIFGTPDLLVEVVSPSSVRRDRYEKKELYARFGVKEIGLTTRQTRVSKSCRYDLHCAAEIKGKLNSMNFLWLLGPSSRSATKARGLARTVHAFISP